MPVPAYPAAAEARHEEGFLRSRDNVRLFWQRYTPPAPRATVAVLPGGGDHGGRYAGLTGALVRAGLEVALLDFRGHGQSDGRRWYVDAFSDNLDDADAFMAHVRAGAGGRKVFVVGHSHGGLVAARWGVAPDRGVAGYVLSSPYFRLGMPPPRLKLLAARALGTVLPWLPIPAELGAGDLTSDPEMQRWIDADPLYGRATTPRWFFEAQRAQEAALREAPRFVQPLLVQTGGADRVADPAAGRAFFDAAGSRDKELRRYEGFRHELYNERERDRPIGDAVAWLLARA
jgi:alpha-beta hydrolase superfamily lysophospholipase